MAFRRLIAGLGVAWLCFSPSFPAAAQTVAELYDRAVEARLEQRFDEAAALLRRALALQPDNADALVQLGFAELGRGDIEAARGAFSAALDIASAYADARFGMAQVEFRAGDADAALAIVEPLAREQPGNAEIAALLTSIEAAIDARRKAAAPADAEKPKVDAAPARRAGTAKPRPPDETGLLMEQGKRLRTTGRFAEAESVYRKVLAGTPRNADALVALGLVSGFQQKFAEAGQAFDAALAIDADNADARLGQVRLAIWQGDLARARRLFDALTPSLPGNMEAMVLDGRLSLLERDFDRAERIFAAAAAADPASAEALTGLGDVRRERGDDAGARLAYRQALELDPASADIAQRLAAPPPTKWRLDAAGEVSELSDGRGTWTDSSVGLSRRTSPDTTVGVRTRAATRYGLTDVQIEARIDHAFSADFSLFGAVAGTPDADFLARFSAGAGGSWRAIQGGPRFGPVFLNVDVRHDEFAASDILTLSPWVQAYFLDERLGLSARWVHAGDDGGRRSDGYVLRADVSLSDRVRLFAGYADAPEISEGTLVETRTIFGGASFDVADWATLHSSYAHEERPTFSRDTFGLGLAVHF